jgi:hypothetical protein
LIPVKGIQKKSKRMSGRKKIKGQDKRRQLTKVQVEHPLSKMLETRSVLDLSLLWISEYLHRQLSILISKSEIQNAPESETIISSGCSTCNGRLGQ